MPKYFITGTDTNVGKTYISVALLTLFASQSYSTLGIKPLSAGGDDAILLQQASTIKLPMEYINPFAFDEPFAPHIAAKKRNMMLTVDELIVRTQYALDYPADLHIIEGAGGFCVPLNKTETMADYVVRCGLPVILVVGIRLGCLNHALLTCEAIKKANVELAAWVANCMEPVSDEANEMIAMLIDRIPAPHLSLSFYKRGISRRKRPYRPIFQLQQ